ncbi:DUF305 domain-containing protein [Streptomyces sp. NPDC058989]|uniref:DUF305 domain-containing protein n=1 Tax=Streptomyces sp. NPDC058989 TaxID=3346686 RepID=UPI00367466D0
MVRRTGVCALTRPRRERPRRVPGLAAAGSALAVCLVLSGCSSEGGATKASRSHGPQVVAPGRPGEPAKVLTADEARKARGDDSPNSADFGYVQMMIPHHQQALVMTALAERYAADARVERLAARIAAAQGPEIGAMKGWLSGHGGPRTEAGHHHGNMPGMAGAAQLERLRAARGAKFDALFLTLMIAHHRGAVTMATEVLSGGRNTLVEEMANDVIAQQSAEIGRMERMRAAPR